MSQPLCCYLFHHLHSVNHQLIVQSLINFLITIVNIKCDLDALNENLLSGFTFKKYDDHAIYFLVEISSGIPQVPQSIIVDVNLHVKLFYKDSPIPLPEWFQQGQSSNCKLTDVGQLENFPAYIVNRVSEMLREILQQMQKRYTSRQSYKFLLNELQLPSFSLLQKLTKGGIDPIKSLN